MEPTVLANDAISIKLQSYGISRRDFLQYCTALAACMALPGAMSPRLAAALEQVVKPVVIWLSFQSCGGCTEAFIHSTSPTLEQLILESIALNYHEYLQAAAGLHAEQAKLATLDVYAGRYILVVAGSIPMANSGFSTIAGVASKDILLRLASKAAHIIAVGSCAVTGGLPRAQPNPTGAVDISQIIPDKTIIKIPGCSPIPTVIVGVLAYLIAFSEPPELDSLGRPKSFFSQSIHDRCYRRPFYDRGLFAEDFADAGAKQGWCLYKLGCKGPITYNACATVKWYSGTSFPIESGYPCMGCSEPEFWDNGGLYQAVSVPIGDIANTARYALGLGAVAGTAHWVTNAIN